MQEGVGPLLGIRQDALGETRAELEHFGESADGFSCCA